MNTYTILTLFCRLTSASLLIRRDAIAICPFKSAIYNGVYPFYFMRYICNDID